MKALLLKDFYVLWKQMKAFLVLILLFSALPGSVMARVDRQTKKLAISVSGYTS